MQGKGVVSYKKQGGYLCQFCVRLFQEKKISVFLLVIVAVYFTYFEVLVGAET